MSSIGEQIRTARKAKGMTQEALASVLNMSRQGISHWEAGRTLPDATMLLKLSQVLEYSFEADSPFAKPFSAETSADIPCETGDSSPAPQALKKPGRRFKPLLIVLIAAILLGILAGALLVNRAAKANETSRMKLEILDTPLYLRYDPEFHMGRAYRFTLSITNESDVPFRPDRLILLMYDGNRITSKAQNTYEEMLPWLDSPYMHRLDTPLHWYFTCSSDNLDELTSVELVLQGVDANGHELSFSVKEPVIPHPKET